MQTWEFALEIRLVSDGNPGHCCHCPGSLHSSDVTPGIFPWNTFTPRERKRRLINPSSPPPQSSRSCDGALFFQHPMLTLSSPFGFGVNKVALMRQLLHTCRQRS